MIWAIMVKLNDNLSGNENYIAVGGDDYPGWAVCDDIELVKQIFMEFVHDGTRHNSVTWREDDMYFAYVNQEAIWTWEWKLVS